MAAGVSHQFELGLDGPDFTSLETNSEEDRGAFQRRSVTLQALGTFLIVCGTKLSIIGSVG